MATRKIIRIDEELCNGCGDCITACAEGALQLVNGKAKLVREQFCDGFGDCIGECPTGALTIEEREADDFDYEATKAYLQKEFGNERVKRLEEAQRKHAPKPQLQVHTPPSGGCPGSRMRFDKASDDQAKAVPTNGGPAQAIPSELKQWPIQLHLVRPDAPFFKNKELVVLSTCAPIASADVHWRFIRGRSVVVACPKLDQTEGYVEKLAAILSEPSIPRVIVLRMEVPCCGGLTWMLREAITQTGRTDLEMEEVIAGITGDVPATR